MKKVVIHKFLSFFKKYNLTVQSVCLEPLYKFQKTHYLMKQKILFYMKELKLNVLKDLNVKCTFLKLTNFISITQTLSLELNDIINQQIDKFGIKN